MPSAAFKDHYDALGVATDASADESKSFFTIASCLYSQSCCWIVRKAYRKRALETHPDKLDPGASKEEKERAEDEFHKVDICLKSMSCLLLEKILNNGIGYFLNRFMRLS